MILHPVIMAIYPVVALYAHNIRATQLDQLVLPIVGILAATFMIWVLLRRLTGHAEKAALMTSLGLFSFFSYGHLFEILNRVMGSVRVVAVDAVLLPVWTVLLAGALFGLYRTRARLATASKLVNLFSLVLICLPGTKIVWYVLHNGSAQQWRPAAATAVTTGEGRRGRLAHTTGPDIYYIVLDAYARADVLLDDYGYDNALFLAQLREKGFFVADQSVANYSQTCLSLGATLNMRHHDDLVAQLGTDSVDLRPLTRRLHENKVMALLKQKGYAIHCFGTGYVPTEFRRADYFHAPLFVLDDFQNEVFNSTPLPVLQKTFNLPSGRKRRILYTLNKLPALTKASGPKFVFAHILAPHEPFIFGPDGEARDPQGRDRHSEGFDDKKRYQQGYRGQLTFVNKRIIQVLNGILEHSSRPPVIILQSDHGPASQLDWNNPTPDAMRERMAILNALYLPGFDATCLRRDWTPINTFTRILNHYLNLNLDLQPEPSRYSAKASPYRYVAYEP